MKLPLRHALALGLLQGPTELLPVSSSGHTTLVPWLAGWAYGELSPRQRKSFEVALHAGTAAALLARPPWEPREEGWRLCTSGGEMSSPARLLGLLATAVGPPALAGWAYGGRVERALGTPATIAAGLLVGSLGLIAGESVGRGRARKLADARVGDAVALGIAQTLALMPGISRSGAALTAARARGFSRADADTLSWVVGLPVIVGAALLQGRRLAREGISGELARALAVGAGGALMSTYVGARALPTKRRTALVPLCAGYRAALAALAIVRGRT